MSLRVTSNLRPRGVGRNSDRVAAYGHGRLCAEPDCTTVLSIYNPSPYCAVHEIVRAAGKHREPVRRTPPVTAGQVACMTVGEVPVATD
jgi:hypothetical protein